MLASEGEVDAAEQIRKLLEIICQSIENNDQKMKALDLQGIVLEDQMNFRKICNSLKWNTTITQLEMSLRCFFRKIQILFIKNNKFWRKQQNCG